MNTLYETRNRSGQHGNSLFLDSGNLPGRSDVAAYNEKAPPGFSSGLFSGDERLKSTVPGHFEVGGGSRLGALERQTIGENLIRSHSAAPSFDGTLSLGPPPGLGSRETPLTSNRSRDSYLESNVDHTRLQLGQRRPASTGVIGDNQSSSSAVLNSLGLGTSSGAVRPAAKTLMDLIQEDFPPESPLYADSFAANNPREPAYLERPRTTSPSAQQRENYLYGDHNGAAGRDGTNGLTEALDRFQINQPDAYNVAVSDCQIFSDTHKVYQLTTLFLQFPQNRTRPSPQYIAVDRGSRPQGDNRVQGSIYAPVAQQSRPQPLHPQQSPLQQQSGFSTQPHIQAQLQPQMQSHVQSQVHPQVQPHVQTQVLPSGHTVYVNAPSPYGYATVQYHPHSQQQHHIVHQTVPSVIQGPNGEQYISVVPIQGAGGQVQSVGPGGTYASWQADGQPGAPQTLTILNAPGPGGVPVTVARVGNATGNVESPPRPQANASHGGRNKEKGKGRRGGGNPGRRGGGDTKHQTNSVCSPLLEEFKAKKNRDWTVHDIKGEYDIGLLWSGKILVSWLIVFCRAHC